MSTISDFVSGLPSYNESNFSRCSGAGSSVASRRPSVYVPTTESPSEILIVNDKTNVLLRYLYRKWAKEERCKKRVALNSSTHSAATCPKKRKKTEAEDDSS